MWMLTFDMHSLVSELAIRFKREMNEYDADYFLRRHKLRRFGEGPSNLYVSTVDPREMIENESRLFIALQVEHAEEF